MPISIRINKIKPNPPDKVTVSVVIESRDFPLLCVDVIVEDQGTKAKNLSQVRGRLQAFCEDLSEALRRPQWFEAEAE